MVCPHNGMLFSNKKELFITWMNFRNAVLRGISQMQKIVLWFHLYKMSLNVRSIETKGRLAVAQPWVEMDMIANGYEG